MKRSTDRILTTHTGSLARPDDLLDIMREKENGRAYDKTGDKSPRSPLVGFYAAEVELPTAGNWLLAAAVDTGGRRGVGRGAVPVADKVVAQVGSKALAVPTVVARSKSDLDKVCTRNPPCPMHTISLDRAIRSGRDCILFVYVPVILHSRSD